MLVAAPPQLAAASMCPQGSHICFDREVQRRVLHNDTSDRSDADHSAPGGLLTHRNHLPLCERGWHEKLSILHRFMNTRGRRPACFHGRRGVLLVALPVAAAWVAGMLGAGLFSCLPSSDLASYSNGVRPIEADEASREGTPLDGVLPDGLSDGALTELPSATGEVLAPAEATPGSDCSGDCPLPVLPGSEAENGSEVASENGAPRGDEALNEGDAGTPAQAASADAGAASCVSGAVLAPNQSCYLLVSAASSWQDARARCQGQGTGWDLATVRSAGEEAFLLALALLGTIRDVWVGASDLQREGAWRWVGDSGAFWIGTGSTGSRVGNAYVNWNDDGSNPEPNGGEAADCLRLRVGGWTDSQCTMALASICAGPPTR
jgi:hypothetical protein